MKYEYAELRKRIKEKFKSQRAFSEEINLSLTSISTKLNNHSGFTQENVEQWAQALDIPKEDYGRFFYT